MQIRPYSLFFFFAVVFLGFFLIHHDEWFCYGYWLAVMVGFVWTLIPVSFRNDFPPAIQHLPMITLLVCQFALIELRSRPISETMFFTFSALVLFRTLMFFLKTFRNTTIAPEKGFMLILAGLVVEMVVCGFHVASTIKVGAVLPEWVTQVSVRASGMLIIGGWCWHQKKICWALIPALVLIFVPPFGFAKAVMIALGAGLMWETRANLKAA